jgi:hypothetical protein
MAIVVAGALACAAISGVARSAAQMALQPAGGPTIHIEDIERF